jgi:uncharacterized protein (TIGR00730 family)
MDDRAGVGPRRGKKYMKNYQTRAPKAYKNTDFLNSPAGRTVRLLSEYLEPDNRLREYNIRDTIVFFGSARILSPEESYENFKKVSREFKKIKSPGRKIIERYSRAESDIKMSKYYSDTEELAYKLTKWSKSLKNCNKFVVTSGGGPGIMEAANRGAKRADGFTIGFNISLPFEQYPNQYIDENLNFEFHYFFMRKFWFAFLAKALVIMPGGFGTLDELMEILTLVQTQKLNKKLSIVIYGEEFWNDVINFEQLAETGMISRDDFKLFRFSSDVNDAFGYLKQELTNNYVKK